MTDLPETQPNDCPLELEQASSYKIVDIQLTEFYWEPTPIPSEVLAVNDESFNNVMRDVYAEVARTMAAITQARIADYLNGIFHTPYHGAPPV